MNEDEQGIRATPSKHTHTHNSTKQKAQTTTHEHTHTHRQGNNKHTQREEQDNASRILDIKLRSFFRVGGPSRNLPGAEGVQARSRLK